MVPFEIGDTLRYDPSPSVDVAMAMPNGLSIMVKEAEDFKELHPLGLDRPQSEAGGL